jgi:hypothetical protein
VSFTAILTLPFQPDFWRMWRVVVASALLHTATEKSLT